VYLCRDEWEVGGFRETLKVLFRTSFSAKNKPDYLNVEQAISLAAGSAEANHIVPCGNDVIQ